MSERQAYKELESLDPDARTLIEHLVEMGYGFDFSQDEPKLPEHLRLPFVQAWHREDNKDPGVSVEDYYSGLSEELGWENE